jgi:uncharacterized membrane protein HdeD (DUF308 family)
MSEIDVKPIKNLKLFWWLFAARGGFALLFAAVLHLAAGLFGTLFFDPIMLVYLSLLLGFYIFGSGILLGVASGFAAEHQLGLWKLLLADCIFAVALGVYIGFSLLMTPHTLGLLAGIHATGIGVFQLAMAIRLRHDRPSIGLLGTAALLSGVSAYLFLSRMQQPVQITTEWLSSFEVLCGIVAIAFAWRLQGRNSPLDRPILPLTLKSALIEAPYEAATRHA